MLIDSDYGERIFRKVKYFREQHRVLLIGGDAPHTTWERIAQVATHMYAFHVEIREVARQVPSLNGFLLRYSGSKENPHIIVLRKGLDEEQKNYTIVKELSHLIVDQPEDWSPKVGGLLRGISRQAMFEKNGADNTPTPTVRSDYFAQAVAVELLYPIECRRADLRRTPIPIEKISSDYRLPVSIVDWALSDLYAPAAEMAWALIENEHNA